jgi:Ser/Thr protein kinase RdoA (MazF antagonist)
LEACEAGRADLSVRCDGYEWRMTVRLDGRPADAASEALYDPYVRVLAELHRALRQIPVDEAPLQADAIEHAVSLVARREDPNWRPATDDASEPLVVEEIGCWLGARFERLSRLPTQLVHGDWTPANVLLAEGDVLRVVAVLDFELSRPAPVELDLAQLFSTLLMWSGYERAERMMRRCLRVYEEASGRAVDVLDVHACMAADWLANYWMGRDLAERTGRFEDGLGRQPSRLRTVLAFVRSAVS